MFPKLLIANRGEIAVRLARACRELGISPVAVYSDVDRTALHVRMADEAVHIGPAQSSESYLSIEKIINAARRTGAQAIHPGYGFLSENAEFAEAVEAAGLVLVGPPASAMRIMGSKTSARRAARDAGVPIVPGALTPLDSLEEAERVAEGIGYPVMLKAAAGGGGKGMRLVRSRQEINSALSLAQAEAAASFKDPAVYIEKYLERPRHIEVQVIGDKHGNVVHLGERECSLQRRHQKVLEECPSSVVDSQLRGRLGEAAIAIAKQAGYWNAGTVEFLVDQSMNWHFLEMNARLQVEHPVTELVVGRDLVHEQIRVAAGEPISFGQDDVVMRGAALECRIYAEDPDNGFIPCPGRITGLRVPEGPGVRNDTGIYEGWEVPVHYDPLLAKLCVWADRREAAIDRLARALDEYTIGGIRTTLPFFRAVVGDEDFRRGLVDTGFIDKLLERGAAPAERTVVDMATIAAVLYSRANAGKLSTGSPAVTESRWKLYGRLSQRR